MKKIVLFILIITIISCSKKADTKIDTELLKKEVLQAEEDFKNMAKKEGISAAFYAFADTNASIKRENDTIITGKDNIKIYYDNEKYKTSTVTWKPDFVDISNDGSMAYTYGKFLWTSKDYLGNKREFKGVFHTVWKKQSDGSWKYVWD